MQGLKIKIHASQGGNGNYDRKCAVTINGIESGYVLKEAGSRNWSIHYGDKPITKAVKRQDVEKEIVEHFTKNLH